jgi:histone H3/H4
MAKHTEKHAKKATSSSSKPSKKSSKKSSKSSTTLKSTKPKHRKILRDNIQGITKPALIRLLRRAGVKRVNNGIYEELRGVIKYEMERILRNTVTITEYNRRKRVKIDDLETALETLGIFCAAGVVMTNGVADLKKSKTLRARSTKSGSRSKEPKEESKSDEPKKAHRFRPGTVALRDIRSAQKNSDMLSVPAIVFERLSREIAQDFNSELSFEAGVFNVLQLTIEYRLVRMLSFAGMAALHAQRESLYPIDVHLVRRIMGEYNM